MRYDSPSHFLIFVILTSSFIWDWFRSAIIYFLSLSELQCLKFNEHFSFMFVFLKNNELCCLLADGLGLSRQRRICCLYILHIFTHVIQFNIT